MQRPAFRQTYAGYDQNKQNGGSFSESALSKTKVQPSYAANPPQETPEQTQARSNNDAKAARERSKYMRSEIFKHEEKRRDFTPYYIKPWQAFVGFALVNTLAAYYSPIQDCDEVFNFLEPTHYLTHGFGFQTWEYSPDFAIRTWLYPALHAFITGFARVVGFLAAKPFQFYFLRFTLGMLCAFCETRLYTMICRALQARVGLYFAIVMITSPGMFHASVAFLPSSLTMYTTMLGMSSFLDWRGGPSTATAMFWMGAGSMLAWPFALAMLAPFMVEEAIIAMAADLSELFIRIVYGTSRVLAFVLVEFAFDLAAYRRLVCFPWNIVKYNVLAATSGKGPNVFGTEPWHYYFRNLLINFNLWFLLALLAIPLLYYQEFIYRKAATRASYIRNFTFAAPMYMWLFIFTIQPHKEERFMYPMYPALALNAALSLHVSLIHLSSSGGGASIVRYIPARLRFLVAIGFTIAATILGASRTLGVVQAYSAPLSVYKPLFQSGLVHYHETVCLGKEWHRFPSSFFLPRGVRGRFVKSAFDGLLPGHFSEAMTGGFGLFPGAWLVPPGMNDENREDIGKYTQDDHCTYFVDSSLPGAPASGLEPDRVHDTDRYERLRCEPFLDVARTGTLARLFWVPDWDIIPEQYRRKWGKYCLLKRKGTIFLEDEDW